MENKYIRESYTPRELEAEAERINAQQRRAEVDEKLQARLKREEVFVTEAMWLFGMRNVCR